MLEICTLVQSTLGIDKLSKGNTMLKDVSALIQSESLKTVFRTGSAAVALSMCFSSAFAGDVLGNWRSDPNDKGATVDIEIGACASDKNLICGVVIGGDPGESGKALDFIGKVMVDGMKPSGDDKWVDGTVWAPDDGETYSASMKLVDERLIVSGCMLFGLLCRNVGWSKL